MSRWRALVAALAISGVTATSAAAQQTHVLIITGLGAEEQYGKMFSAAGLALFERARADWKIPAASLIYLAEDPAADSRITAKSTKEEVQKAFTAFSKRVAKDDAVLVFLLGHGSGEGAESRVNLPGPDPTAADYNMWITPFAQQRVVFVNASSASGDFMKVLSGPGRVIITATKTSLERNESHFATPFIAGIVTGEADGDKDGRISALEAFDYAKKETARIYETANKLMTEHAMVSDTVLARYVQFGGIPVSSDPRVLALVIERRALEDSVTSLRAKKAQMDSTAYTNELERLLLAIAEKTQAIKAAGGKQ